MPTPFEVVDAINAKLPGLHAEIPASVTTQVMNDSAKPIRDAISDVKFTLLLTIGLVVLVIYLFTGHLTATLIPGLAVPLSLISTFGMMYVLGYSVDNISLLGLTLAVGLVVDDAIVMLENILRHVEDGMPVLRGGDQGGGRSQLHDHLDVGVADRRIHPDPADGRRRRQDLQRVRHGGGDRHRRVAIVSLTVTPMLASRLGSGHSQPPFFIRWFDAGFERTLAAMTGPSPGAFRTGRPFWRCSSPPSALTIYLFMTLPTSFFPTEDIGRLNISTRARQDISYPAMKDCKTRPRIWSSRTRPSTT
jgi:HAE1 family hydrophobic/amphiphilic exporter-1